MKRGLLVLALAALAVLGWGYANILADPVERRTSIAMPDWPKRARPVRVALVADIHMQGPDMPPDRVGRIVDSVNAARPDLILLAGDFVGSRTLGTREYPDAAIARALSGLRAPLGVFAVLGNHDHWRDGTGMAAALARAGIRAIDNRALRVGPLLLAGAGDAHTGNADVAALTRATKGADAPILLVTHSPDVVPDLPPRFGVVMAGHTHCGQIVLPLVGQIASASRYGDRYRCGVVHEGPRTVVVSAGLGASVVPFRFGAPPDWWLVTLGPVSRPRP